MQRFVVGTGRCGTTLLGKMLGCHPDGLILPEMLGSADRTLAFKEGLVSPKELKEILQGNEPMSDFTIHRNMVTSEQQYEVKDTKNFKVPGYLYTAFPSISDEPDVLFDEMLSLIDGFQTQTMAQHYSQILGWLQNKFGKDFWIERSGPSVQYMPDLYRMFPHAKFLHIHRDGPDVALSMSRHFYFQMLVSFFFNPPTREELEQTELAGAPVTPDDPISRRLLTEKPTLEEFADYWNYQIEVGYSMFAKLDASQFLDLRFEDIVENPRPQMERIAEFFQLPDSPGWIDKAAALVSESGISSRRDSLTLEQQASLIKACQPGRILLDRYRHPWINPTLELIKEVEASFAKQLNKA